MEKVNVTICTGNYCCGTEAAWFKQFDRILSAKLRSKVEIAGADCPGYCLFERNRNTPHVTVNGYLVPDATPQAVIKAIRYFAQNCGKGQNRPDRKAAA